MAGEILAEPEESDLQTVYDCYSTMLEAAGVPGDEIVWYQEYMANILDNVGTQEDLQEVVKAMVYLKGRQ
ncbi:hypothetical protein SEA_CANDLE_47 [Mycobacterium phage Candle]|uniref:Uncharacterized protein n=2 Tax=Papyrusvirus send513 TaxID=1982556 RepID=A0A4D6TBI0_9CAUD|nr:hypothetical protein SEA_ZENON_48 [Mycobacterium phage Zenon]QCG78154.1 hypothetical protein SEA_CANDLE_47 [Mycobacterium phage Candle]